MQTAVSGSEAHPQTRSLAGARTPPGDPEYLYPQSLAHPGRARGAPLVVSGGALVDNGTADPRRQLAAVELTRIRQPGIPENANHKEKNPSFFSFLIGIEFKTCRFPFFFCHELFFTRK